MKDVHGVGFAVAQDFAVAILALEERGTRAIVELFQGGTRTLLSFYQKRARCDCLKVKHDNVKAKPKLGTCYQCDKRVELSGLKICGGCGIAQFCSSDCQKMCWPVHKEDCETLSSFSRSEQVEHFCTRYSYGFVAGDFTDKYADDRYRILRGMVRSEWQI